MEANREALLARWALTGLVLRQDFAQFVKFFWPLLHSGQPVVWNWHLQVICEHLQALEEGRLRDRRLIVNMPPGMAKSLVVSVFWPAWIWARKPQARILAVSGSGVVVLRDSRKNHDLCSHPLYRRTMGITWQFSSSQDSKTYFVNTAGGERISATTGQKIITGLRADYILIDDPLDASQAYGDSAALREHVEWYDRVLSTRGNPNSRWVLVMQRLHERDLTGHLQESGKWEHLILPNEYDGVKRQTSLGPYDPRTKEGELLFPFIMDAEATEEMKRTLGTRQYQAQYQQQPAPAEARVFDENKLRYYGSKALAQTQFQEIIISVDPTGTQKKSKWKDYFVAQVWGRAGAQFWLLDQHREKADYVAMLKAIERLWKKWKPSLVLIESTAAGPKIVEYLRREKKILVKPVTVTRTESKEARAAQVLNYFDAEAVYFPTPTGKTHWVRGLIEEMRQFPYGRHDDQVDAMVQALLHWKRKRAGRRPLVMAL